MMKKLFSFMKAAALLMVLLFSVNTYAADEYAVSGATGISNGKTYSTLKAVFDAINGASATITASDDIVVAITANPATAESASASLNAGNWKSLKIYPTVTGVTIKGAISGALINLNGADKVTIDGRVNGVKDLIISNTFATPATATQAIQLIADASNNVIQYCTIKGASIAATNGTVLISTGTATGNDNNTIDNCDIADGATLPACGICFNGSATTNDGNTVSNCNIYNVSSTAAMSVYGINVNANTNTTTINANRVYWTSNDLTSSVAILYTGIRTTGKSNVISNNIIGNKASDGSGTATISSTAASRFLGIDAAGDVTSSALVTTITGNTISNILFTSNGAVGGVFTGVLAGIYVNAGFVYIGTNSTNGNTIRDMKLITSATYTSSHALNGIAGYGVNDVWIKYNKIYNLNHLPSGVFTAMVRGIQLGSTATATRTLAVTITGNEIHDLTAGDASNNATATVQGICNNVTGTGLIEKNSIYNLKALNNGLNAGIQGISTTIQDNVSKTYTYQNNMICLGNDVTTGAIITGINLANPQASPVGKFYYYNNSVYIGIPANNTLASTGGSYAFNSGATNGAANMITLKNNIFSNMRTNTTAGVHYLVKSATTTANTASWFASNANFYQMPTAGTYNQFGYVNSANVSDLPAWKAANAKFDPNSISGDPKFVDATNVTTPNLHIQAGSAAAATVPATITSTTPPTVFDLSATVGEDFDGDVRGGGDTKQDFGADDISNETVAVRIFKSTVPANGTYAYNNNMDFTVVYNKLVTVAGGTPFIPLTLSDASVKNASYVSGSGTKTLTFRYTTGAAVVSTGITVGDINLNGATMVNGSDAAPLATAQTLASVNIDATYGTSVTAVALPIVAGNASGATVGSPIIFWTGAVLDYQVTFGEAVTVTGTPRIPITLTGGAIVSANYIGGTGTSTLTFRYVVDAADATGIITTGTAIDLNGGTIKQSLGMNSFLTLNNVSPAGRFLSIDFGGTPPVVGTVPASGKECRWLVATAPANGTYGIGQNIDINVTPFSTTAATTSNIINFAFTAGVNAPYIPITLDNGKVVKAYCTANGTVSVGGYKTFRYTIASGDVAANGITMGNIELNGSSMNYGSGVNQVGQTIGLAPAAGVKVVDYTLPSVSAIAATYGIGQTVKFTTTYPEVVNVTGTPSISVMVGATAKTATYLSGSGSTAIVYGYTVVSGDEDADGITIASQDITLNGGTLKNTANVDVIAAIGVSISGAAKVANLDMPYVTSVAYPAAGTYGLGANLDIYVTVNKAVTVTGTPYFPIAVSSGNWPNAFYQSSNADNTVLKFRYTVTAGAVNTTGVLVGNMINVNGGSIKDATADVNMTLYKGSSESTLPTVLLDGTIAQPMVTITAPITPTNAPIMPVTITFSKAVTGFDVNDLVLVNGFASDFVAVSATEYTVNITAVAIDASNIVDVTIDIAAGAATDAVNFGASTAATQSKVNYSPITGLSKTNSNAAIYAANQSIMINGLVGQTAGIYSLGGQLMKSVLLTSDKVAVPSAKGFYIVKVGTDITKVLVK